MKTKSYKKVFSLALIMVFIASMLSPMVSSKAIAADVISVSDAISSNTGSDKTVEGYIVGAVKGGSGTSISFQLSAPFIQDTNLAIADSPNETDKTKILPVQLPAGAVRDGLNLKAHPENLGKKVQITGDLMAYFSVPGHKNAKSFSFVGDTPSEPQAEPVTASPDSGLLKTGTKIALTTATENAAIYYTLDGTNPTSSSNRYSEPLTINEDATVKAIAIKDGLKNSEISSFKYTVAFTGLRIHDIQGASHQSPFANKSVADVEGVVTHVVDANNFYMQDTTPDLDENTSDGILIYQKNHGLKSGDAVKVTGQVKEWVLEGYADKLKTDLPVTEINAENGGSVTVTESGHALPAPVVLGDKGRHIPTQIIDNDNFGLFDPKEDGIDFYESLEGMRVEVDNPKIVAPQNYGELVVVTNNKGNTPFNTSGAINISKADYNPERIFVDINDSSFIAKSGDYFKGNITGVMSYSFSNYKVLTNKDQLPTFVECKTKRETTKLLGKNKKLTIASFNVENFSANKDGKDGTSDEKAGRIADSIVHNLNAPDIVGLIEMQDGDGPVNDGKTDAKDSADRLINEIKAKGGPSYEYTDIAPIDVKDGGIPGGNIRVAFIYNPDRVSLAPGTKGTATQAVEYKNGKLSLNPGRIDPTNPAFENSRKPLAAQFMFNGEKVTVIANHFNSKGGDQPMFGKNQPPVLSSEVQRLQIAGIVNNFVKSIKADDPKANVVLLGDFNDFEFTPALEEVKGNELSDMIQEVPYPERYSYSYQGNAQVLDHILVSNNLKKDTNVDIVHINSQFMEQHGRASDHDPVVVQVKLKEDCGLHKFKKAN
ncbi:DUF6359 domain-containing protein [Fictibacillus sp. KIGAM418]|uniref:DUF6359 domain-containing protein n=1 Tax=Fictibacillus marinisediminis TaxID=2878389 RepID=A0A9X1X9H3_9BACL|nr:DUF6359 domain-containing protein [Fictibacillus marinisediminis]MCK6256459.1 DUF6359 domain-containing protein [Fictibacillus marinisediminis]